MTSSQSGDPVSGPGPKSVAGPVSMGLGLGLAAVGGVLYFTGFVGFGVHVFIWFCFVPALIALEHVTTKRAILIGVVFGAVTNSGGYYWIIHLLEEFADAHWSLAWLGFVALCTYQGGLLAVTLVFVHLARTRLDVAPVWSLPVAFVATEKLYPLLFPSNIGNAFYEVVVLTQVIELTGMLGLTALVGLVNGAIYEVVAAKRAGRPIVRVRWAVPVGVFAACLLYGAVRLPMVDAKSEASRKLHVAMVQTNLGARDKKEKRSEFVRRHREMSMQVAEAHPDIDLIVWPESAYNYWISRETKNLSREVTGPVGKPVLFGALTYDYDKDGGRRKYNSAVLLGAEGDVLGTFDKVVLLMFGETIPFYDTFPIIKKWFPRSSVFTRGTNMAHLPLNDTTKLLTMICYEDIIPEFVRNIWTNAGPAQALVNITNDSWYGDTNEPEIHMALASFRTIETRRAMIRSTNTGISVFVDPAGRVVQRSGQWTQETLRYEVPMIDDNSSTIYMLFGDVLGWLALGLLSFGFVTVRRRSVPTVVPVSTGSKKRRGRNRKGQS